MLRNTFFASNSLSNILRIPQRVNGAGDCLNRHSRASNIPGSCHDWVWNNLANKSYPFDDREFQGARTRIVKRPHIEGLEGFATDPFAIPLRTYILQFQFYIWPCGPAIVSPSPVLRHLLHHRSDCLLQGFGFFTPLSVFSECHSDCHLCRPVLRTHHALSILI